MLAGASGVDLAMLVVAADDSVKPQTREHLDVLKHLQLKVGLVVITKCDLVEPDWIELVESEIHELTKETFLANSPIIRVCALAREGIDELRDAITLSAQKVVSAQRVLPQENCHPPSHFRMAVDRVFTIAGHGTVVTGSVASGQAVVGDKLELQPQGTAVRIRGLQSHDQTVGQVGRGQRAAINLTGVHYDQISRGQNLVTGQTLCGSELLTVRLQLSDQLSRFLKHRTAVRLHVGTASVPGKLSLLGKSEIEPGGTAYAQLFLSKPVAAVWGQPFVIRSVSPVETLGGGRVLDASAVKIKRIDDVYHGLLDDLSTGNALDRAAAAACLAGLRDWQPAQWSVTAGVDDHEAALAELVQRQTLVPFRLSNGETKYLHRNVAADVTARIIKELAIEHQKTPLRTFIERSRLAKHFRRAPAELISAFYVAMQEQGQLTIQKQGVALPDWSPQLSEQQQHLLRQIEETYHAAKFQPPSVDQIAAGLDQPLEAVSELVDVAVESGGLIRLAKDLLINHLAEREARTLIAANMANGNQLSVSQIREFLGTTRKIAVPLCEYWDAIGITQREGDLRRLVESDESR
jgi:selenocysteine-specific elongation factor